jgi:hypothetical protein
MPLETPPGTGPGRGPTLVLVTGSGRSGTSTVSGALKKLGLSIPQPEVEANSSNPRGFFEPRWAVDFHKRVLAEAGVRTLDARPGASELALAMTRREDLHAELRDWFADRLAEALDAAGGPAARQVVVKDPRAFWLRDLWTSVADELGVRTEFLTMLRHPPEVVGSRDMHYLTRADEEQRRARETANIAGWVNVALTNERLSRAHPRVFVHYADLIADWRSAMGRVADELGLTYDVDLADGAPHEIDDFIDAGLRRSQRGWEEIDVPADLRAVAEDVWDALDALSRSPHDAGAQARLDKDREVYDAMFTYAVAMTQDHTNHQVDLTRRRVRRRVTQELRGAQPAPVAVTPSVARRLARKVRSSRRKDG